MAYKPTREDFIEAARQRYRTQPTEQPQEQGIFSDALDLVQRGAAQTLGGDLETVGQLTDSQGIKDAGRGVTAWGESQLQQVSTPMREAMGKQFFTENPETGAIEAGDAWGDWRALVGQGANVLGQIGAMFVGTKGAGVLARPMARGAATAFAKDLVEGKAKELVAKQTVKEALQNGALDSVRAAYAAAPTDAARRAVLDQAMGRLGAIGYGAHTGAMASGMRAQQAEQDTRELLNSLDNDKLNSTPSYQQAYWDLADGDMQGASPDEIRRAAIDSIAEQAATQAWSDPKALAADFASGYLGGAVGGIGGAAGKIGASRAGAAVRGVITEGATEALQGGTTQYAVNQAVKEWADESRDPMAGVLATALNEGAIGGLMGGTIAGIAGPEAEGPTKPVIRVERRDVTGNVQMDDAIFNLDKRQAERGAAIDDEISKMFSGSQNPLGSNKLDPISDIPAYQRQGFVRGGTDFQGTPIVPLEGELIDRSTEVMPLSGSTELGEPVNRSPRYEAAPNPAALEGQRSNPVGEAGGGDSRRNPIALRDPLSGELLSNDESPIAGQLPGATYDGEGREIGSELPYRDVIYGEDGRPAQQRAADIAQRERDITNQPRQIGQSDTIFAGGTPGGDQRNNAYTPPRLSRDQIDTSLGEQSTRDPRSPVSQSIANAGSATDSVFGPLKTLRVTRAGKPFATEKEAVMASRRDQEMPVPLNGGGFGVAQIAEVQQAQTQHQSSNSEQLTAAQPVAETQTPEGEEKANGLSEEELKDRDLLKEHAGRWKYRGSVGASWFTANTKDSAIDRAQDAYRKAVAKGEQVPTRSERAAKADAELFDDMDRRYGRMSMPELQAEYQRLGGEVTDLQMAGKGEFNGNGGRRTGAAVSNEGARQTGEERLRLGIYMKMRQEREGVGNDTPAVDTISSEQQGDQPGAGEPVLPMAEPSRRDGAGVPAADNAGGAAPDAASMESQQDDQALNWSAPKSSEDYRKAQGRLFAGDMSYAEFKAMSRAMLDNAGALRAELEQKTKADLLQMMSAFNAARYKNEKKAAVVEAAYNQLLGDLRWAANGSSNTMSETYALGGKRQSIEERVSSALDGLTEARYQQFIDKQHADMAELERRRAALKQALTDPQTLEDFRAFVERRGSDKLTTDQRARYEDLVAASNMDKREAARDAKAETKVTATAAGDIIQTKHSKTGEELFVVQMGDRVDRDTYNTVNAKAKEMGGWYSSFRGKGAVPGFQFKDKAKAAEFKGWLAGETATQAKPDAAPTEITEPSNNGGKGKQVETLRQRADSVRAKADAALNAERKENTAKRAGQAANARANAERDLRFADLLDAIATGIEAGEITYLRNLANGAQLEELQSALNRGLWNLPSAKVDELVSQGVIKRDNNSRHSWSDKATPEQQVEGVTMPGMDYYTDRLRDAAFKMQSASGFKQAGVKIMSLVKAATNRDSKRVTLSDPELIAKLKAFVNGSDDFSTSTIKDQIAGYSRLERMGITNQTELRAALRELVRLQKGLDKRAPQSDPLAEQARNLKLRLLNNRNAFIDFFPTPEAHAADLAARAGIEPGMKVLEPSAGHGMLADAARAAGASVDAVELASDLRDILQTKGYPLVGTDFMATEAKGDYDAVIMNPPFSNDMDIDHVRHAYDHLKPGGRLVAIVSAMAGERSNRKNKAFAEWLESLGAEQEMMPEGAFKDSLNPTSVRTKIITIEKPSDAVQGPTIKAGSRATLHTPKGKPVEVQYRLVEAGDLVASHEFDGTVNRAYPQEMQPRDRSKGTYQVQVRQIANNPEGQRLGASPETDRGAPIVRDGVVESGNGRTIGLKQAYRQGSAEHYRAWLVAHAADFGLSPDEVAAMSQPVLVRERLTEMDAAERRDFVVDSNTDAKMANSASEDAKADAGRLDDRLLGMLNIPEGGNLLALSNEPFLNAFARAIGENSLNQYKDDKGRWNDAYQRRVANAIFAYGYDSDSLLKAATGDSDSAGKNITSAMMNNAAKVAELRAAMPDHAQDLVALLTEAVETMNSARRNGQSIAEVVSQGDMMSGGVSHAGGALAEMLADASRSAKRLTETVGAILDMLNESASHAGQVDMLTGEQARTITAEEAINAQAREYRLRKEREQAAPRSSGDLFGVAGPRNDHGKDSGVSGSAGQGQEQSRAGGLTVEGVSIAIPTIDQALQESYNSVTYRGKGLDVVAGIRAEVGRILLTLKESGLLETPDQKSLAQKLVQRWADEEAGNAIKKMRFGVQNPSWMITGRSGRKQGSNSALDAENRREAEHHNEQSARIQRAKAALKELRSPEIIRAETFKNEWRSARTIIAEMGSYITSNRAALLAEYRKNVNKTLMDHLNAMQEADPARFSAELSAQDQRLRDAGMTGLVEVVGPRSNPGKLIAQTIDAQGGVRFSKQSQTEGAIPAKHLTRKEAELVTREWLKQYKGVAGIDIQIHATQAEMEQALGLEPKEGLIRRAAFDRDESGLHVAADTISNARQLREILRHEVLAHYGLANVLGGGEYTNLMSRIIASKDDPSMRDVWQWVETHYADEDIGVQAEEVIAHLAELEPSAWRRGWEKVVNWLTKALRAVGFLPSSHVSATEIRSLVEALGNELQGGKSKPVPEGQRFSQRKDESGEGRDIRMSQTATDSAMDKLSLGIKPDIIDRTKERLEALRGTDKSTVKKWVDRFIKKANTEMLDALAPIKYAEDAAGVTEAGDSGYVAARLASGSAATMQATMLYGLPEWKDGVIQRKAGTGESDALLGIFEGLGKDLHNWLGWMAGHRAEILMKEGRENLLTVDEITALKALDKGKESQFQEAKQKWNAVNKAVLDLAEEAGLFTKADRANWESEWYIPFFRESEDGDAMAPFKAKGLANQSAGIKKLKGGSAHTADLLENIFASTGKLIDASMKNMAAQKTVWNLADTDVIEVIAKPNMMDWRSLQKGHELITVKMEGEDYLIRVKDPDLYRAMTFFDRKPFGAMVNYASKAKRLLTAGVTASPEFMLRNFLRDSLSAWAISKDGFQPMIDSLKGVRKTLAMDGSTLDVMFSGASFLGGYVNGNDPGAMADSVRKALRRKGMTPEQITRYEKSIIRNAKQAQEVIAGAWDKYAKYGEAFENANREAVYDAAIKAGKSHAQAAFEAKDLMDFSMLGASRTMQMFVQVLPFFNARVQGLGKLARELRDNPRAIAKRAGMITAGSLALMALNWDDERYQDLPDWDKDTNWHFFFGDQHFRIPKPFEIGVMFATIPERMVRAAGGKDTGEQFGKALARAFADTFALNPTPQVIKPLVESYYNYDSFKGAPIENMADLAVRAEARYNENTSLLMREIGQATGMSPKKLEHLMIGYTGTIGSYVMATADGLIRWMSPGESAGWRADEIPVVKAFYRGSAPAKSTQQMDQFYSMLDEVNKLKRTVDQYRKEGMTDEAKALMDKQGGILRARSNMSRTQQQIRQVRNEMELIQRDTKLTADQKRERLDRLMSKRNKLVADSVRRNLPMWD